MIQKSGGCNHIVCKYFALLVYLDSSHVGEHTNAIFRWEMRLLVLPVMHGSL